MSWVSKFKWGSFLGNIALGVLGGGGGVQIGTSAAGPMGGLVGGAIGSLVTSAVSSLLPSPVPPVMAGIPTPVVPKPVVVVQTSQPSVNGTSPAILWPEPVAGDDDTESDAPPANPNMGGGL